MKRLILLKILLLLPALVSAQFINPFRDFTVLKEFDNTIIAGNQNTAEISFIYKGVSWTSLVVRLNITSLTEGYSFNGNEFTAYGLLRTKSLQGTGISEFQFELKCEKPPITFNQTGDKFNPENNILTFYCYNETFYIVMPLSQNNLTLTIVPHVAIQPATFNFTVELLSEIGVIVIEPEVKIENGNGYLYIGYPNDEYLEFYLSNNQNANLRVTVYSQLFISPVPRERPFGIVYFDIKNETSFNGELEVRYYFNPLTIISKGYDLNNLRFYKFEGNVWKLVPNSGVVIVNDTLAYVYARLTSLSIYGIFTSFYYPQTQAVYSYPTYTTVVQNVTNVTQVIREVRNLTEIKEVPAKAVCGNGICEVGESCSTCEDCKCPSGYKCSEGVCIPLPTCGNNVCEVGENSENCPEDCGKVIPTGYAILAEPGVIGLIVSVSLIAGIVGAILSSYIKKFLGRKE